MRLCDDNLILEKTHGSCDLMSLIISIFSILVKNIYSSRIKFLFLLIFLALTKVYERANSVVTYDVHCPTWLHKYLIGKKGSKLQELIGDLSKQVSNYFWFGFSQSGIKEQGKNNLPKLLLKICYFLTYSQKELFETFFL